MCVCVCVGSLVNEDGLGLRLAGQNKEAFLSKLEKFMDQVTIVEGSTMDFQVSNNNSTYQMLMGGRVVGAIESPEFCRALCDTYLDANAVSPAAKSAFADNFPALIKDALSTARKVPRSAADVAAGAVVTAAAAAASVVASAAVDNGHNSFNPAVLVLGTVLIGSGLYILNKKTSST